MQITFTTQRQPLSLGVFSQTFLYIFLIYIMEVKSIQFCFLKFSSVWFYHLTSVSHFITNLHTHYFNSCTIFHLTGHIVFYLATFYSWMIDMNRL